DQDKCPRKVCFHNTFNQHLHHCCLRRRDLVCAVSPCFIQQVENTADSSSGNNYTDHFADLLFLRCCAYNKSGFQVLRSISGNCGNDTDYTADCDGSHHTCYTVCTCSFQKHCGNNDSCDGHTGYRVV